MFQYGSFKLFAFKIFFGLTLIAISVFTFASILTYNPSDPGFRSIGNLNDQNIIPTFPNAKYVISKTNWDTATNPNSRERASFLPENFIPIKEHNQLVLIDDNQEIMEGINGMAFYGHTNGQQLIKITVDNNSLVFCSDLIPLKSHLRIPWVMGYDINAVKTMEEKTFFLEQASKLNWLLFFYHDPNVIAVRVKKSSKYYDITEEYNVNE